MSDAAILRLFAPQTSEFVVNDEDDDDFGASVLPSLGQPSSGAAPGAGSLSNEEHGLLEQERQLVESIKAKLSAAERQLASARSEATAQAARADRLQTEAAAASKDAAAQKARADRAGAELNRLRASTDPSGSAGGGPVPVPKSPVAYDTSVRVADFESEQTVSALPLTPPPLSEPQTKKNSAGLRPVAPVSPPFAQVCCRSRTTQVCSCFCRPLQSMRRGAAAS